MEGIIYMAKNAFTLAEVLITLGIIGVVAALTIPALISKYDEKVMLNKLKRSYSEILNAIDLRRAESGSGGYAQLFNPSMTEAEQLDGILKYLKVIERCSASDSKGCGGKYKVYPKNRSNDGYGNVATSSQGGERAILSDGTLVRISKKNWTGNCQTTYTNRYETDENGNYTNLVDGKPVPSQPFQVTQCAEIFFDTNGPKGRNQYGYDMYGIVVTPTELTQQTYYGGLYDTMRTGKLSYEKYSEGTY